MKSFQIKPSIQSIPKTLSMFVGMLVFLIWISCLAAKMMQKASIPTLESRIPTNVWPFLSCQGFRYSPIHMHVCMRLRGKDKFNWISETCQYLPLYKSSFQDVRMLLMITFRISCLRTIILYIGLEIAFNITEDVFGMECHTWAWLIYEPLGR